MTSYNDVMTKLSGKLEPAQTLLEKPFTASSLRDRVREILSRS